ncbi:hypothetical protein GCM10011491_16070 [Brucella endophytica]|uniref:Uncharacterized protein n=1 Tax=Brucella endophytica TaxID=1963359 RepID=A0A916S7W6_9HYPH|nr:hypothetical protein GCM10011491_16070 [Brucella endophytica]
MNILLFHLSMISSENRAAAKELCGVSGCDMMKEFDKTIWERPVKSGADGATAPETLRQKDQNGCEHLESGGLV